MFVLVQLSMVMLPSISFLSWASAPGDTAASTYLSVLLGYESYRHYLMIMSCFGTFSCEVAFHQVTQYGILDLIWKAAVLMKSTADKVKWFLTTHIPNIFPPNWSYRLILDQRILTFYFACWKIQHFGGVGRCKHVKLFLILQWHPGPVPFQWIWNFSLI